MDHTQAEEILSLPKDAAVLGTTELSAFVLSLRDRSEFSKLHPAGYHCIPHIGTYGQYYTLSSPMVLVSLPATPRYLRCLPNEVLNSLDLEQNQTRFNLMASSPTTLLDKPHPHIPVTQTDCTLLRSVARKVAWDALISAYNRVLCRTKQMDDMTVQMEAMSFDMKLHSDTLKPDWTIPKQGSSVVSLESKGYVEASSGVSFSRKVAVAGRTGVVCIDEDYEEELRIVAKKLVNKALHLAYKTVESLYRRSSIEYLIASTKRMKISHSPSPPPPTVFEESNDHPKPLSMSRSKRSPSPDTRLRILGAKRQRSGSHDITMLYDQNQTKKVLVSGRPHPQADSEPRHILRVRHGNEPPPMSQLANIAFSVSQMSIAEESDEESDEESYTILEAVQRKIPTPEPSKLGNRLHYPSPTVPLNHMYPPQPPPATEQSVLSIVVSPDPILDMDLFVIVHSYPPPSQCQKFLCVNTNEVNLVYHCWLYKDSPFVSNHTLNRKLEMGVFCPQGVEPVHLNLVDAGVPFNFLDERTVCIHNCCFSPENAQLQLATLNNHTIFHSFFSVAKHGSRKVVAYHVVPGNTLVEQLVRSSIQDCCNLRQLLLSLANSFPALGEKLASLILPMF